MKEVPSETSTPFKPQILQPPPPPPPFLLLLLLNICGSVLLLLLSLSYTPKPLDSDAKISQLTFGKHSPPLISPITIGIGIAHLGSITIVNGIGIAYSTKVSTYFHHANFYW